MNKNKKTKSEKKVLRPALRTNPRVEEIVKSYPEVMKVYPRGNFEDQLRTHLLKAGIK